MAIINEWMGKRPWDHQWSRTWQKESPRLAQFDKEHFFGTQGPRFSTARHEICLGVCFALCLIKAIRLGHIEHCSGIVVTRFLLPSVFGYFLSVSHKVTQFCTSQTTSTIARRFHANWPTHNWSRLCPCESPSSKQVTAWRECSLFDITKNAPYAWGNFHACAFTRFQKPQQLGRAWIACSSIVTSRAQRAEPDLNGQRCCKLRLKLLLVAKKTWKLIVEFVTTKRLVCKNGHSLFEPPSRVFYTVFGLCMSLRRQPILSKSLRTPAPVDLTIHTFHTVDRTAGCRFAVVARFGKRWEFGDNRKVCKAFVCQYAPPRSCCSWGPVEANCCMSAPRRLHWMASVMVMWSTLSSQSTHATFRWPNGFFFICTLR